MNDERIRQLMIERVYGEISPDDDRALSDTLAESPALAEEMRNLEAARQWLSGLSGDDISEELSQKTLDSASKTPAASGWNPAWGRWLAAATVLAASGAIWLYGQSPQMENTISDEFLSVQTYPLRSQAKPQPAAEEVQKDSRAMLASSSDRSSSDFSQSEAEELFRTGLGVYNQAFAKTGDEKDTLLRSAIITLRDVAAMNGVDSDWAALANTLIADAHRELGELDEAISTYKAMIDGLPESNSIRQQAQYSMVELMLENDASIEEIGEQLNMLADVEKQNDEYASLALSAAEHSKDRDPVIALNWVARITSEWPASHIFHQKALRLEGQLREAALFKTSIQEWWVLGPLGDFGKRYEDMPPLGSNDSIRGQRGMNVRWQTTKLDNGELDLNALKASESSAQSVFLSSFVHSTKPQAVIVAIRTNAHINLFVNQIRTYASSGLRTQVNNGRAETHHINASLQTGWNELTFKAFFQTSEAKDAQFYVSLLDRNLNPLDDIDYSLTRDSRN